MTAKKKLNLPKIIIIYGPPAAGKGTQSDKLSNFLPSYYHLDFGTELRNYCTKYYKNYRTGEDINTTKLDEENLDAKIALATEIYNLLTSGNLIPAPKLRMVIEETIVNCVENGQGMIIEGPGRTSEEAHWLSNFLSSKGVDVAIFHLHVSLNETVKRVATRYYVEGISSPFKSYQEAKAACPEGQEPYRRAEDNETVKITHRYHELYADHFAAIVSIYQKQARASVYTIDAAQTIEAVWQDMLDYLKVFYNHE